MALVNQTEFAKHRGVSQQCVSLWIREGKLRGALRGRKGSKRKLIDVKKADACLRSNLDPEKSVSEAAAREREKEELVKQAKLEKLTYSEARTLNERYKAALRKLEFEEKSGQLISTETVSKAAFDRARQVRDALLNIPDRTAPILAAESDSHKIIGILTNEIRQALEGLSK